MSLFSKIFKGLKRVAGPVIGGAIGGPFGAVIGSAIGGGGPKPQIRTPPIRQMPLPGIPRTNIAGAVGPVIRSLPAIGRVITSPAGRRVIGTAGGIAAGVAAGELFDQFGNPVRKKRRRMNPCNEKALRRAIRRVQAYDRQRKRVDKALKAACPPPRRRARRVKPC